MKRKNTRNKVTGGIIAVISSLLRIAHTYAHRNAIGMTKHRQPKEQRGWQIFVLEGLVAELKDVIKIARHWLRKARREDG